MSKYSYNPEAVKNLKIEDTSILDSLIDFESARKAHLKKEHSKVDKRMSLKEAIAEYVKDGDILSDAGFAYVRTPHQAYFEMMRQGKKGLQAIGAPNTNQSYLINYGTVAYSHNSYIGAEMRGTDRNYSRQLKNAKVTILSEWSHGGVALGVKASQLGAPGLLSKQMLGSDIMKYNPYVKTIQNPMRDDPDPVAFIPALYPDITIIHVQAADKFGNAYIYGPVVNDAALAAASRKLIITAEEIVPENALRYNGKKGVTLPFMYADAVVELPFGAVPGNMPGCYYWSRQWWEKTMRYAGPDEERFIKHFNEWVMDTKDQFEFVEKLGGAKWIAEARRQTKAAENDNEDIDFSYQEYTLDNDSGIYY
ncbi:MAG TPA: CoA transferase subunit A [Deltaproteobacteria bacterium]|nr:CoA transferase subunit A [Deltaproteobacteria bacterium]